MHIPTHILSGWCIANTVPCLTPKDRLMLVLAASIADIDGVGILWSTDAYLELHHVCGHNLVAAISASTILGLLSQHRALCIFLSLALFHLHLLMDFYGSGQGWGIACWWPFSDEYYHTDGAWSLGGWQNYLALAILIGWSWRIHRARRRTPFELLLPVVDRAFLNVFTPRQDQEL